MSQAYSTVLRKNLAKPQETPKYYAVGHSGRSVSIKDVAKRIAERSSYSRGELEGCVEEYLLEILHVLEEGNIVQFGDLGNFRLTIKTAKATTTSDEFKASCIEGGHVVFFPGKELRKLCRNMEYIPYKGKSDLESGGDKDPSEGGDDDGKGEAPNPGI